MSKTSPKILLVGIDPDKVDYSAPDMPAGLSASMVHTAIAAGNARFAEKGLSIDICLLPPGETSDEAIVRRLAATAYDVVVIGGGIRKPDAAVRTFEMAINAVRAHAPQARIAFNTNPVDSLDAALRWL